MPNRLSWISTFSFVIQDHYCHIQDIFVLTHWHASLLAPLIPNYFSRYFLQGILHQNMCTELSHLKIKQYLLGMQSFAGNITLLYIIKTNTGLILCNTIRHDKTGSMLTYTYSICCPIWKWVSWGLFCVGYSIIKVDFCDTSGLDISHWPAAWGK